MSFRSLPLSLTACVLLFALQSCFELSHTNHLTFIEFQGNRYELQANCGSAIDPSYISLFLIGNSDSLVLHDSYRATFFDGCYSQCIPQVEQSNTYYSFLVSNENGYQWDTILFDREELRIVSINTVVGY